MALGCRGVSRADFRGDQRIEGTCDLSRRGPYPPGKIKTSIVPELASVCGHNFDELVQWMVQGASLDRRDRRGPKLI